MKVTRRAFLSLVAMTSLGACASGGASSGVTSSESGFTADDASSGGFSPREEQSGGFVADKSESKVTDDLSVEILESGWSYVGNGLSLGVTIHNRAKSHGCNFPKITASGRDSDGKVMFTHDFALMILRPDETVTFAEFVPTDIVPDSVEVSASVGNSDWVESALANDPMYVFSNTGEFQDGDYINFTGDMKVVDSFGDLDDARVSAVLRDGDGKIVGGFMDFVDNLAVGDTVPVSVTAAAYSGYSIPDYASFELTAIPW